MSVPHDSSSSQAPLSDLTLLGNSKQSFPNSPSASILETFPNRNPDRDYWVKFHSTDFTSLCPVTGQPDYAQIDILYVPGQTMRGNQIAEILSRLVSKSEGF